MVLVTSMTTAKCAAETCFPAGPWSDMEQTIWRTHICGGKAIDLTEAESGANQLSVGFLQDILSGDPWSDTTKRKGLRIKGAIFTENVVIKGPMTVDGDLRLESCTFVKGLTLGQLDIKGTLSLAQSKFSLDQHSVELQLTNIRTEHDLDLSGLAVGRVEIQSSIVGKNAYLMGGDSKVGQVKRLWVHQTKIGSDMALANQTIGEILLDAVTIGGQLRFAYNKAQFVSVYGTIHQVLLESNEVDLFRINQSSISGDLIINGGTLKKVELTSSSVKGRLRLRNDIHPLNWVDGGAIDFSDSSVRVIKPDDYWPANIRVEDFHFDRFITLDADAIDEPINDWLKRVSPTSLEPYSIFGSLVRKRGEDQLADGIMKKGWELRRLHASGWERVWLNLRRLIGQGYDRRPALLLLIVVILCGRAILYMSDAARAAKLGFWYSVDLVVPFVKLVDDHHKVELETRVQHYFRVHKIVGYLLISLLAAGFSGFVK